MFHIFILVLPVFILFYLFPSFLRNIFNFQKYFRGDGCDLFSVLLAFTYFCLLVCFFKGE